MKPGDLVRFSEDSDFPGHAGTVGIIISEETNSLDMSETMRCFEIMINSELIFAFDSEIEVINEAG